MDSGGENKIKDMETLLEEKKIVDVTDCTRGGRKLVNILQLDLCATVQWIYFGRTYEIASGTNIL